MTKKPDQLTEIIENLSRIFAGRDTVPEPVPLTPLFWLEYSKQIGAYRLKGPLINEEATQDAIKEANMVGILIKKTQCADGNMRYVADAESVKRYFAMTQASISPKDTPSGPSAKLDL